jgi:hypothetical protein
MNSEGEIRWDENANSQGTTQEGETYLGNTITFVFNSFIDAELWDGPGGDLPAGDKLTSTIKITGHENEEGELTSISATKKVDVGPTPIGTANDYYPGLGDDQNKFTSTKLINSDGGLVGYNINFEQHASVSSAERIGLSSLGYRIVNVAQKLNIDYSNSNGSLTISPYTDIFPSATLKANGKQIMYYPQPSFVKTHSSRVEPNTEENPSNKPFYTYKFKPAKWYRR